MPNPTIKPETRCECRNDDCAEHHEHSEGGFHGGSGQCCRDAVRLVTVNMGPTVHPMTGKVRDYSTLIPMCEPCATFHETKEA